MYLILFRIIKDIYLSAFTNSALVKAKNQKSIYRKKPSAIKHVQITKLQNPTLFFNGWMISRDVYFAEYCILRSQFCKNSWILCTPVLHKKFGKKLKRRETSSVSFTVGQMSQHLCIHLPSTHLCFLFHIFSVFIQPDVIFIILKRIRKKSYFKNTTSVW